MSDTPLQLERFVVEALSVKANHDYDPQSLAEVVGKLSIDPEMLTHKTDSSRFLLSLRVRYRPDPKRPSLAPYAVEICGKGYFSLQPSPEKNPENLQLITHNGFAILYGLLRRPNRPDDRPWAPRSVDSPTANLVKPLQRKLRLRTKIREGAPVVEGGEAPDEAVP